MKRTIWLMLFLFIIVGRTLAQADCPAIVDTALQTASDACTALIRNQACYGNVTLEAEAQPDAEAFTFEQTGDIVNLSDVASLSLSAMDTAAESWGVALLLTQANLPDTLPGQNVTMVLFGEVDMTSAVPTEPVITPEPRPIVFIVTASSSSNVRGGPSTNDAVVASLNAGDTLPTDGRTEDGTWLRVILPDESVGWVFAELVTVDGEISQLRPLNGDEPIATESTPEAASEESTYTPMQAFYFASSIGDSTCAEAPDSGILIQTPQGAGTINLLINEVEITLGSTAYLTAGDGVMTISVIEGQGTVSAFGTTVSVPAGTRAHIPLDSNGLASGAPVGPAPYDATVLSALPIVLLPQPVTVATPLTDEEIAALNVGLQEGEWTFTVVIEEVTRLPELQAGTFSYTVTFDGHFDFFSMYPGDSLADGAAQSVAAMIGVAQYTQDAVPRVELTISNTYSLVSSAVPDGLLEFTVVSTTLITGTFQEDAYGTRGTFTLEANE